MKYTSAVMIVLLFAAPVLSAEATRSMSSAAAAGAEVTVTLTLDVNDSAPPSGVILKEYIPPGWSVLSSSPAGYFNQSQGIIKWVLYGSEVKDRTVTYTLRVPGGASGSYTFSGEVLTLAGSRKIDGSSVLSVLSDSGGSSGGGGGVPLGGGGGSGRRAMPLAPGINMLTPELVEEVLDYLNLKYKLFYRVSRVLAAPLLVTGDVTGAYPAPESAAPLNTPAIPAPEDDVYELAAESALQKYTFAETVVIARGDLEVDAIAAVAFAKKAGAPILLTEPDRLPESTEQALLRLTPARVIIVGGPVAVSPAVEERLRRFVPRVERIGGRDRYETSLKLILSSSALKGSEVLVVADGRNVSTDVALIAGSLGAPVLYVSDHIPPETRSFLAYRGELDAYTYRLKVVLAGVDETVAELLGKILASR